MHKPLGYKLQVTGNVFTEQGVTLVIVLILYSNHVELYILNMGMVYNHNVSTCNTSY